MEQIVSFLQQKNGFLILTHRRPDGDTLGSAAGLCAGLRALGKTAYVAPNPEVTPRYLPFVEPYFPPADFAPDTVLTVDTATREMMPEAFKGYAVAARIDHHPTEGSYAPVNCVRPEAAACGEIVLSILRKLRVTLTQVIATPLYLAISTDTGCFRYGSTTADTHRAAALLMDTGMDSASIDEMVFSRKSRARIEAESAVLQGMEFLADGRIAIGRLSLALTDSIGAVEDDLENVSALPRQIQDVVIGITMRQEQSGWKLSVRTNGVYMANKICARMDGGGHERAAGCRTDEHDPVAVRRKILAAVQDCYPETFSDLV